MLLWTAFAPGWLFFFSVDLVTLIFLTSNGIQFGLGSVDGVVGVEGDEGNSNMIDEDDGFWVALELIKILFPILSNGQQTMGIFSWNPQMSGLVLVKSPTVLQSCNKSHCPPSQEEPRWQWINL